MERMTARLGGVLLLRRAMEHMTAGWMRVIPLKLKPTSVQHHCHPYRLHNNSLRPGFPGPKRLTPRSSAGGRTP